MYKIQLLSIKTRLFFNIAAKNYPFRIDDALDLCAFSSQYICNILEQRQKYRSELAPLHLIRNSDCLDIELDQVDLNFYSKLGEL